MHYSFNPKAKLKHHRHHGYHMHYCFNLIRWSITSITIAIPSITCITASILLQCQAPSHSRLSHALQLQSYNNVHHQFHHVYHMHYRFNPITTSINSITIAITSITCIKASILYQCPSLPSPSPTRLLHALQLQSYNNVNYHRHHIYHML